MIVVMIMMIVLIAVVAVKAAVITDFFLFDLILYVPSTNFQLNRDGSSWVEPVLS